MTYQPPQRPQNQPPHFQGPPQQSYSPAPQYGAPPPGFGYLQAQPPKKRPVWPWVIGIPIVLFALCGVLAAMGVLGIGKEASDASNNAAGENTVAGKMGAPARDGKFEFTVMDLTCGKKTIGDDFLKATAQGQFCLVTLTVSNIGKEAQTFSGSDQKAYAGSTQFSDDLSAELQFNSGSPTFLQQINPGNQVSGTLIYDVPSGTKLTSIELHDSPFSGGVKMPLS